MTAPPKIPRAPGGCHNGFVLLYKFVSISSKANESSTNRFDIIFNGSVTEKESPVPIFIQSYRFGLASDSLRFDSALPVARLGLKASTRSGGPIQWHVTTPMLPGNNRGLHLFHRHFWGRTRISRSEGPISGVPLI